MIFKRTISFFRMVRNYIRNTSRGLTSGDIIRRAVKCVSTDGLSSPIPIDWVQCYGWAHDACTGILRNQMHTCQNCESDDDVSVSMTQRVSESRLKQRMTKGYT